MNNKATLAGGCFWGMEALFRNIPGVLDTEVGYCGGDANSATYAQIKTGATGHAEAIQLTFDATVVSFIQILDFFFRIHDPSTLNRHTFHVDPRIGRACPHKTTGCGSLPGLPNRT